jgi:hypothetical protein
MREKHTREMQVLDNACPKAASHSPRAKDCTWLHINPHIFFSRALTFFLQATFLSIFSISFLSPSQSHSNSITFYTETRTSNSREAGWIEVAQGSESRISKHSLRPSRTSWAYCSHPSLHHSHMYTSRKRNFLLCSWRHFWHSFHFYATQFPSLQTNPIQR